MTLMSAARFMAMSMLGMYPTSRLWRGSRFCLSIDWIMEEPTLPPVLLGATSAAMMILAGHMQYVLLHGISAALYVALHIHRSAGPLRVLLALILAAQARWRSRQLSFCPGWDPLSKEVEG